MEELITKYADEIRGIKVRISRSIVGDLGIAPLEHALELGSAGSSRSVSTQRIRRSGRRRLSAACVREIYTAICTTIKG